MTIQTSTEARYNWRKAKSLYWRIWISGNRNSKRPASVTPFFETERWNQLSSRPSTERPVEADRSFINRCSQLLYKNNNCGPLTTASGTNAKNSIQKMDQPVNRSLPG